MMGSTVIPFLVENIGDLLNNKFYKKQIEISEQFLTKHEHFLAVNTTNDKE
jgi:hypothetical protein